MTTVKKLVSAAAMLSMAMSSQGFAQAAIQEPGAFAFYHPDADVLNGGRPTPAATAGAMALVPFSRSNAHAATDNGANAAACARRYRSFDPASGSYLGHDGSRHRCQ